jgi:hypothetical protein
MDIESGSNGIVMFDFKDALLRWSKSWAELAEGQFPPEKDTLKVEDLESDAGYASEGSCKRFYLGSKSGSVVSLEDCVFGEEEDVFGRTSESDDVNDREDADDADDVQDDSGGVGLDVSIEMIGGECVLVNEYKDDGSPSPTEASRDGLTPEVNLDYDHEDVIELASRFLAYCAGRNQDCIVPKIRWATKFAPDYDDDSDS